MRLRIIILPVLLFSLLSATLAQVPPRVAVIDLAGDDNGEMSALLQSAAARFSAIEAAQMRAAVRGAKYDGSLNMTLDEARALGAAIGCDYYFAGRTATLRRLDPDPAAADRSYHEAIAGIYLIDGRSGRLLLFDYLSARAGDEAGARARLIESARARIDRYEEAIGEAEARRRAESESAPEAGIDAIEILDGEVAARGIAAPVFYQRLKPEYPPQAASLDIVATVELTAVFGADGKVSDIEVTRWAGFGLDEAAIETVRRLRFKPASRAGREVSVRALVRYNFRRPQPAAEREAEAEKLRRSLRRIQRPQ